MLYIENWLDKTSDFSAVELTLTMKLTLDVDLDPLADRWRHTVGGDAEVSPRLCSL